jgi:hypothetical protein
MRGSPHSVSPSATDPRNPQNANRPELLFVQAHGVKGVAKAMLSKVTNVYAVRYEGVAYTLLTDNAVWARRAMQLNGGR